MGDPTRKEALGITILNQCRNELYSTFPYLDGVFSAVTFRPDKQTKTIRIDGTTILFSPEYLMQAYVTNPAAVRRGYLHMLLHCLYLHIFRDGIYQKRLWNLACDIMVECLIEQEHKDILKLPENKIRQSCFWQLRGRIISAEVLYKMLETKGFGFSLEELEEAFAFDDPSCWDASTPKEEKAALRTRWEQILAYTVPAKEEHMQKTGRQTKEEEESLTVSAGKYDYKRFLKQFSILQEEVELDTDSFDYILYNYGMERYGNMPLIEPLEYKEMNKLEELVIAIDTSGSCSKEIVQRFLSETYNILSEKENFFKKMNVYIIQCDCAVRHTMVIHSEEEWKNYCKNMTIYGRGGTDFRPVFSYVEELKARKELRHLKALIYFTDGDGVYPIHKPDYETAFVFLEGKAMTGIAPGWASILTVPE